MNDEDHGCACCLLMLLIIFAFSQHIVAGILLLILCVILYAAYDYLKASNTSNTQFVSKAYFNCHTDITIPYDELQEISVITKAGMKIPLLAQGRFVLTGTEVLNEPLNVLTF